MKACALIFSCHLFVACTGIGHRSVIELDFFEDHSEHCQRQGLVTVSSSNQAEARTAVFKGLAETGANAVVFVGASKAIDPESGAVASFTERAVAYRCSASYLAEVESLDGKPEDTR